MSHTCVAVACVADCRLLDEQCKRGLIAVKPHLATVPGDLLIRGGAVVMEVCHSVQPHDVDPVRDGIQLEHRKRPQRHCARCQKRHHAAEIQVGCLDLQVENKQAPVHCLI